MASDIGLNHVGDINIVAVLSSFFLIWLVWFGFAANYPWVPVGPIKTQQFKQHPTRNAYKSKTSARTYLIIGGSGFVGSWICRYLLNRGESEIYLFDRVKPPTDILKKGVNFVEVDLIMSSLVEREMYRIAEQTFEGTKVIVYSCSLTKRYEQVGFRCDLGVAIAEIFTVTLRFFDPGQVCFIHVGDSSAHRLPIRNWDSIWPSSALWCQQACSDIHHHCLPGEESVEDRRDRCFSCYAWHQLQVETIVLEGLQNMPSIAATAVLRMEGFCSGHLGDGFLSPTLQKGRVFIHSPNAPISIVNVQDVVRGCLSLERQLSDPETRDKFSGQKFTVGSNEVTTLKHVTDYIQKRRPSYTVWHLPVALVYFVTWVLSFVYMGPPSTTRDKKESILQLSLSTLTFPRFYTLQVGQIPNKENQARQHKLLKLENNFSLSQTLDTLIDEIEIVEQHKKINNR